MNFVANMRALEPLVGEKLPTAVPDPVFDEDTTITSAERPCCCTALRPAIRRA